MLTGERSGLKVNWELGRRYTSDCLRCQESRLAPRNRETLFVKRETRVIRGAASGFAHRQADPVVLRVTRHSFSDSFGRFTCNVSPFTIDTESYSNTACSPIARLTASNNVCA